MYHTCVKKVIVVKCLKGGYNKINRRECVTMDSLNIKISDELVPYICTMRDGETVTDKVNLSLILGLFASQLVTLEKAAELAGKSVWDFMEILKSYHIPWGEYTEEEMQLDDDVINKLMGGLYE